MKHCFVQKRFQPATQRILDLCDEILTDYAQDRIRLTLRALYYRFKAEAPPTW